MMIIFNTYAICIVAFVIVLLKDIRAPVLSDDDSEFDEMESPQSTCFGKITSVFPEGLTAREHAEIAINTLIEQPNMDADFFAYYAALEDNSDHSSIPPFPVFCPRYGPTMRGLCILTLVGIFGGSPKDALHKAFYKHTYSIIESLNAHITQLPEYSDLFGDIPNFVLEYWIEILLHFRINDGENGIRPPRVFCDNLYN